MATELQNPPEASTTSLVGGILDDVQDLVKQQIQLARKEVNEEIHKASEAAQLYAMGGAVLFLGAIIVGLSLAYLLHWASSPADADPGRIPLWACHAIVGVPLALIGGILTWLGREKVKSINPLHNPAAEALKENVKWATNTK